MALWYTISGYQNKADFAIDDYEMEGFEEEVAHLWEQVKPLYIQLHTYVKRNLMEAYGPERFPNTGHIPAHLLGYFSSR